MARHDLNRWGHMGSPRRIGGGAKSGIRSTTHRLRGSHRSIQGERMRTRMHFRTTAARLDADRGPLWGPTGGYTEEQPGLPPIRQSRPFDLLRSAHRMNSRQPSLNPRDRRDREQAANGQPGRILRLWGHDGHDILSHGNVRLRGAKSTGPILPSTGETDARSDNVLRADGGEPRSPTKSLLTITEGS